jgi:ubiquitin C-terminal hydrolase
MEEEINTYEDTLQCEADDNENEISSKKKEEYENFTKLLSEQSNFSLTPLENLGNTCYMNSILICLSHNLDLSTYFLEKKFLTDPSSKNDSSLSISPLI